MSIKEIGKKAIVPLTSAVVGGLIVAAGMKFVEHPQPRHQTYDDLLNDHFAVQSDPFLQMKQIRHQMEKHMAGFDDIAIDDIATREDDSFVYYDIKVDDVKSTSIETKIGQGYVTITGTVEKKSDSENKEDRFSAQSLFKSSFNRTFPLPENIDANKMQMLTEKDKVILKFPKIKA